MTRRSNAPDSILTLRVVAGMTILAGYVVLRLPDLTSPWEAAATWIGAVVCGSLVFTSLEEIGLRRYFRARRVESIREAVTETFATPMRWPDEVETAIATARHEAMQPLVDRGEVGEPTLFTHEYNPLTPPHGTAMPMTPAPTRGRHRRTDPSPFVGRERIYQLFGEL
jgi:hypothetical protein